MYIITYVSVNNDTYESRQFVIHRCINSQEEQETFNSEELTYEIILEVLPTNQYIEKKRDGTKIHNGKVVFFDKTGKPYINWTKKDEEDHRERVLSNRLAYDMPDCGINR